MELSIPTFVFTIINLIVLYFILKRLLFKPVSEFMEKRANSIKETLENADKSKAEARDIRGKYLKELESAGEQADRIIKDAIAKARVEYDQIIQKARADAEAIRIKANEEIERERNEAIKDVRNQVVSLALEAASKVMEENMNTDVNRKLVNKFIDDQGVA
ncbi:MAG: F0F1 ATP synthase subunit B [Bacillota bacterium]